MATVWWTVGWNMVLLLNGINGIPEELYEASRIDGAPLGRFQVHHCPMSAAGNALCRDNHCHCLLQPVWAAAADDRRWSHPQHATSHAAHLWGGLGQLQDGTATAMAYVTGLFMLVVTLVQARFLSGRIDTDRKPNTNSEGGRQ